MEKFSHHALSQKLYFYKVVIQLFCVYIETFLFSFETETYEASDGVGVIREPVALLNNVTRTACLSR